MEKLEQEIIALIINDLELEELSASDIDVEEALFGEGLGLDSIDALELGISLQKKYNIKITAENEEIRKHFYSVRTIAKFVKDIT
jgi:acyl carrier protein